MLGCKKTFQCTFLNLYIYLECTVLNKQPSVEKTHTVIVTRIVILLHRCRVLCFNITHDTVRFINNLPKRKSDRSAKMIGDYYWISKVPYIYVMSSR